MLVTSSFSELMNAKSEIDELKETMPIIYDNFLHVINLTRQLQFKFQYMGCLIMDEEPNEFLPNVQDDYVLALYQREIEKLKVESKFLDLKRLLADYEKIGYANLSALVMGKSPEVLVGPKVVR
ncbi:hypothetical protein [Niallia sp. 01092]|uniref:hypothetical protein n=1 Tax=unclassified Niallia TaxID=2837522 RepID=UPI003FD2165C